MKKITRVFIVILTTVLLSGCYNKAELKRQIQAEYDRMRSLRKAGDFCFYLGQVTFPYDEVPRSEKDLKWQTWNKAKLAKTLPLFFELGLLEREQISHEPVLYRYTLTTEGEKYQYYHPIHYPSGNVNHKNAFCYGERIVLKVTDVSERKVPAGHGGQTQIKVYVDFDYKVKDIPNWVTSPNLLEVYPQIVVTNEDKVYEHEIYLIKRQDGLYDEGRIDQLMLKPRNK